MYAIYSSLQTDEPIMLLNQQIGYDKDDSSVQYIDGAEFQKELLELDQQGYKCIKIFINSPGGNVVEGWNICNAIAKTQTPVDTYNIGIAASMAAVIFMSGRKRIMADYSSMMIHAPYGGSDNKMLEMLRDGCVKVLSAKCNMSEAEVGKLVDKETWMGPAECLEKGFCTEIEYTSSANIKRMPKVTAMAMWKEANLIQSNFLNKTNMSEVSNVQSKNTGLALIAAYLELNVDASENSVFGAIKSRISTEVLARSKAEDEVAAMKKQFAKMEGDMEDMKSAIAKKDAEIAAVKKEKEDAAAAAAAKQTADAEAVASAAKATLKVQAKAVVDTYVGKRINADAVDLYVDLAMKTSIEDVKAALEKIPLNKVATPAKASAETQTGTETDKAIVDPHTVPANSMGYMAQIKANSNVRAKANA